MSFHDLAGKIYEIRMNRLTMLAKTKYAALAGLESSSDTPSLTTILSQQQLNVDKLNDIYDKVIGGQGNREEIYTNALAVISENPLTRLPLQAPAFPLPAKKTKPKISVIPDDFPYHKLFKKSFDEIARDLIAQNENRVTNGSNEWLNHPAKGRDLSNNERLALVVRRYPDDTASTDIITDLVTEPVRIRCKETSKDGKELMSPKEAWEDIKKNTDIKGKSYSELRESVYKSSRGCNLFNITLGIYLLNGENNWKSDERGGGDVLDPASGWGDRLGAAFIAGAKSYTGWDTNTSLQPVYKELADKYTKVVEKPMDWRITAAPFEDSDLQGKKYDTVLTSPPFFTKELYQGTETSTSKYSTRAGWINNYYKPMWKKSVDALRPGGRVIAYISNGWMFTEANQILQSQGMKYLGAVGFIQQPSTSDKISDTNIRDAYIWKKPIKDMVEKDTDTGKDDKERAPISQYHSKIKWAILKDLKEKNELPPSPRILDLSCGRGGDLFKYIQTFGKDTYIVGVDIDAEAINEANRRIKDKKNIKLIVQDLQDTDASIAAIEKISGGKPFDFIVCNFAVHYFYKTEETLDNFVRLVGHFSKPETVKWFTFPDSRKLKRLLIDGNIKNNKVYELSANKSDMDLSYGGKVDFRLVGTTYFDTALPGENIITSGTSHEYFANPDLLTAKFSNSNSNSQIEQVHFNKWGQIFKDVFPQDKVMTERIKEISYSNVSVIIKPKSMAKNVALADNIETKSPLEILSIASRLGYTGKRDKDSMISFIKKHESERKERAEVIEPLNREKHYRGLSDITSNPDNMRLVGNGKPWDLPKLKRLFTFEEDDKEKDLNKRKYISYAIMSDRKVAGLLQFHPTATNNRDDPRLYITIFIDIKSRRKGLATMAISQAISEIRRNSKPTISFGAHIAVDNIQSINLHQKLKFQYEAVEQINNKDFLAFALPPPLPEKARRTYILDLENLELDEHHRTLAGFRKINIAEAQELGGCEIVITHGALATDKRMYNIVSVIRSRIYAESITNKVLLHRKMEGKKVNGNEVVAMVKELTNQHTVPTFNDSQGKPLLWIWRPEGGWAGKGITVGKGQEDLQKLFNDQEGAKKGLTGLLTKFNDNTMLLPWCAKEFKDIPGHKASPNPVFWNPGAYDMNKVELRKFHLRVYVVIISDEQGKRMGLYKGTHLICFADKEFIRDKYDDIWMHNTRLRGYNVKIFPDSFNDYAREAKKLGQAIRLNSNQIMEEIKKQLNAVATECMPSVRPYAETHIGCEILGCDIMLNEDGTPWIVEMNKKHATFKMSDELAKKVSHNLYQGLFQYLVKPGDNEYITEVYHDNMILSVQGVAAAAAASSGERSPGTNEERSSPPKNGHGHGHGHGCLLSLKAVVLRKSAEPPSLFPFHFPFFFNVRRGAACCSSHDARLEPRDSNGRPKRELHLQ